MFFFLFLVVMAAFFVLLYVFDNKYTARIPLPENGVLYLEEKDIQSGNPIFLIDDWMIMDGIRSPLQWDAALADRTYIGEFSNYSRGEAGRSPLGSATYQLRLHYAGKPASAAVELPELFENYRFWIDDELYSRGSGTARVNFMLTEGMHTVTVGIEATKGYYAGMYFPGSMGSPESLRQAERIRSFAYALAFFAPVVLLLFSMFLWQMTGSRQRGLFALLCLSFSAYVAYYFVQSFHLPFAQYWYVVEDVAFYAFLFFSVKLSVETAGFSRHKWSRVLTIAATLFPLVEVLLYFLTPVWDRACAWHSVLQDVYRVFIFLCLAACSMAALHTKSREKQFVLLANVALGTGIFINLLFSNRFEPIYLFWQMEWCGLLLVALFACRMVLQNKHILAENACYQSEMEQLVEERTRQLGCLLEERRAFFSDMAHELKAPLFATNAFIQRIRQHGIELDEELTYYIGQVEQKQEEMSRRVQSLHVLNDVDKLKEPAGKIEVRELLSEVYQTHNPEAAVGGIHLIIKMPTKPLHVFAKPDKLMVVFENLIYNALRFTPAGGFVTVSCHLQINFVRFQIEDDGCGISPAELPHVFDRFFVGTAGKSSGSGLGLYIVKNIVEESGGTIWAESRQGKGASFSFTLPVG